MRSQDELSGSAVGFWILLAGFVGASGGEMLDLCRSFLVLVGQRFDVPLPLMTLSMWSLYAGLPLAMMLLVALMLARWPPSLILRTPVPDLTFIVLGMAGVVLYGLIFPVGNYFSADVLWKMVSPSLFAACVRASTHASFVAMALIGTALSVGLLASVRSYRMWKSSYAQA
jgi:hypothetical protein